MSDYSDRSDLSTSILALCKKRFLDILDQPVDEKKHQEMLEKMDVEMRTHLSWINFRSYTSLSERDAVSKRWNDLEIKSEELADCARQVKAWDPSFPFGLFIYGPPGNGKTHMMKALIQEHYCPRHRFKLLGISDVMAKMRDFESREYFHGELMEPYGLILDDLGTENASEYEQNQLFRILEHRKEDGKHVFMTSNLGFRELEAKYTPRILSRLGELMAFVENKAPSHRKVIHVEHKKALEAKVEMRF